MPAAIWQASSQRIALAGLAAAIAITVDAINLRMRAS